MIDILENENYNIKREKVLKNNDGSYLVISPNICECINAVLYDKSGNRIVDKQISCITVMDLIKTFSDSYELNTFFDVKRHLKEVCHIDGKKEFYFLSKYVQKRINEMLNLDKNDITEKEATEIIGKELSL